MRTLVANIPLPANRFLVDLNAALERHMDLTHDHEAFWNMIGDYDVVHLHFPEYMTFEIQNAYLHALTDELIAEIEKRLQYWSERSVLVITRHVLLPHDAVSDPRWEKLYETVYRYVDGVVHFAEPSVEEFKKRYADTPFVHGHPAHWVVPHHNYASLPNQISREEARRQLGIANNAKVLLVFGAIRNDEERELILNNFRRLRVSGKMLLVSRWREKLANVSWIRLKYWLRDLTRLYYKLHPQYRFNYAFVEEEDAQIYMNAADVLFIPRLHVLNSGNVTMGMTFGKVVVGPDSLDVGHLLKSTGNVVFDPDRPETASDAIAQAMELARQNRIGPANQERALTEWSAEQCADQYVAFSKELRQKRANMENQGQGDLAADNI
jgi:glycosyltransferase involved in cell wall biosynthesis